MPTYEFRCPNGHEFEKFYRTISGAEAQAACPECGERAERKLSPAGLSFKGSGFYLTDYGKNAHRDKGSAPKSASSDSSASSGSGKSDTKSDSTKSAGESSGSSSGAAPSPAPAAESKPAAKKSTGE